MRSCGVIERAATDRPNLGFLNGLPTAVLVILVGLVYVGVAKLGLSYSQNHAIVSAVWPPSGVGLALVFMLGYRVLPGIAIAAVVANATGDSSLPVAAGIAFGNTVSAALGAWLLHRAGFTPNLKAIRDVLALSLLGAAAAPALNATIGNATLWIAGLLDPSDLWNGWRVWWLADLTGVLLCAPPVFLLLNGRERQQFELRRVAEASAGLALLAAVSILILNGKMTLAYPVFPLLVLVAMRYRQLGAVIAAPIVSIACIYFTDHGQGPFVGGTVADDLLRAQLFVGFAALTALMVAAARTEWERSENALVDLAESRRALAEAQELAHIGSWEWEFANGRLNWSDELYRIFGVPPGPARTFESYLSQIHPDERSHVKAIIESAVAEDRPFHIEHRIVRSDGDERHLDCHGRFSYDRTGNQLKLIGTAQDVTEQRMAEAQLNYLATHDPLTGLCNRALFLERLNRALAVVDGPHRLAVLFCDLDDFKSVNDSLGHETGDKLLAALPPLLELAVPEQSTIARFGGDEFAILLDRLDDQPEATRSAERLQRAFGRPIEVSGRVHHVTASIGIVLTKPGESTATEVMRDADAAMYRAKSKGRGQMSVFDEQLRADLVQRVGIENDLRQAIDRDELDLVYQPVYSTRRRSLVGVEALIRWRHPEKGLLFPDQFVKVAEAAGMIGGLGFWTLERACRDAIEWQAASGRTDLVMSVNISPTQISDPDLPAGVRDVLASTGVAPEGLAIEITESAFLAQDPLPMKNLEQLRNLGMLIVLDDFGTGYSSLSHLRNVPFDVLKIDREFIADLGRKGGDESIVEAVLSIAESRGVSVVAEGVETETQFQWLRDRGCRFAQGYYFTKPLSLERLIELGTDPNP